MEKDKTVGIMVLENHFNICFSNLEYVIPISSLNFISFKYADLGPDLIISSSKLHIVISLKYKNTDEDLWEKYMNFSTSLFTNSHWEYIFEINSFECHNGGV